MIWVSCYKYFWSSTLPETGLVSMPSHCLQYEFCTASNEHCEGLGMRLAWDRQTDRQTMNTWILEDGWLVRAACRTMMGSRGMARCVKMKQRRLGPTRCLRSFQWRSGWTASYWLIWRKKPLSLLTSSFLPSYASPPLLSLPSFPLFLPPTLLPSLPSSLTSP